MQQTLLLLTHRCRCVAFRCLLQCNDAYSALVVATELAKALNTDVNSLPLSLDISWFEQKAVAVLLTLLNLGLKNIRWVESRIGLPEVNPISAGSKLHHASLVCHGVVFAFDMGYRVWPLCLYAIASTTSCNLRQAWLAWLAQVEQ